MTNLGKAVRPALQIRSVHPALLTLMLQRTIAAFTSLWRPAVIAVTPMKETMAKEAVGFPGNPWGLGP
jgi:hypothetical protein